MVTVRTLRREDIDQVAALTARTFGGDDYESAYRLTQLAYARCPFMPLELGYCAEIEGKIVAKWQLLDLTVRLGVSRFRTIGAHAVVVDPMHNGRGLPQQLLSVGRPDMEAKGYALLLGFAQRGSVYTAMGAVPVCADYEWSVDGLSLPAASGDSFRDMRDEDVPAVVDLYNRAASHRGLGLVRSAEQWPWLTRRPPRVLLCERGYLGLRETDEGIELREVGFADPSFARTALEKLGALARERGVRRVFGHLPIDHPVVELSRSFGAEVRVTYPKRAGAMAGIVQIDAFLRELKPELEARLSRSAQADCSLALELVLDGTQHSLLVRGDGVRELPVQLTLTTGRFLQLAFGYKSVRNVLLETNSKSAEPLSLDPTLRAALDAVFPAAEPFFWHTDRF